MAATAGDILPTCGVLLPIATRAECFGASVPDDRTSLPGVNNCCANDCSGVTADNPSRRYCCGTGILEAPEGDGAIRDSNFRRLAR
jgi:hypothetical protein